MCAKVKLCLLISMSVKPGLLTNRQRPKRDTGENIAAYERGKTKEKKKFAQ
jgi:hypothetical protein